MHPAEPEAGYHQTGRSALQSQDSPGGYPVAGGERPGHRVGGLKGN